MSLDRGGSMKPKTCPICRIKFMPSRAMQKVCSPACAYEYSRKETAKAETRKALEDRKTIKIRKDAIKTIRDWTKEAQIAVNAYRRELLKDDPCISCGRYHSGQYHAGHYISVGAHPELRFEELNIWKQCQPCNTHLSGNLINYRKALVARIGIEKVEWLEGKHDPKHYSLSDIKEIIIKYRGLLKEIKRNGL